jgi:alkanesulfonate monooxygenase SsuD/methylene tetrahydromethanopterin reductase-like flavin-dependent oxidoreductase (luciferase family)
MEFGVNIAGPVFKHRLEADPDYEHRSLMNDIEVAKAADRAGFKYVWASEHHFLHEYSHLSANVVVLSFIAAVTDRIHVGSGIFNPLPQVIHPAKLAETVAMLDHVSEGRFEFGTGRGAGSHEILGFLPEMTDLSKTRGIWEDVIEEFAKMWGQDEYEGYQGQYWQLPPRRILPKPWKGSHPALWYACGNTSSYEMAARRGLGVLGFSVSSIQDLEAVVKVYKDHIDDAEPVGDYVNDNIMVVTNAFVSEDPARPIEAACSRDLAYLVSNTFRYHDTFPHPETIPYWPELIPNNTPESVPALHDVGFIVGDPDHALRQCRRWEAAGVDQLVLATGAQDHDVALETIRLMGEHVIPKLDIDPVHRTTRFRQAAAAHRS